MPKRLEIPEAALYNPQNLWECRGVYVAQVPDGLDDVAKHAQVRDFQAAAEAVTVSTADSSGLADSQVANYSQLALARMRCCRSPG